MPEDGVPPTDVDRLPRLADEVLETLLATAGTAKKLESLAEDVLEQPDHLTTAEERGAAREALAILEPVLEDAPTEEPQQSTPTVPEEFLPDGEVVLGTDQEGDER